MLPFKTDDGSISYRKVFDSEPFHTKSGAITEAVVKHARALRVWEKENPVIFDVCSGLGYSAVSALEEIRNHNNTSFVTIYLFENDLDVLKQVILLDDFPKFVFNNENKTLNSFIHFKNATRNFLENNTPIYEFENTKIIIVFGDFEETINSIKERADFVFYAPFSPLATPNMWMAEKFQKLFNHMNTTSKLSTYSYARRVREGLMLAGFRLEEGPILGRRSPSLIAIKD